MQAVTDVLIDAAIKGERSPLSRRYAELYNARQNGYLTEEEMQRVCYCDLFQQKRAGELRTNRYIPAVTDSASDEQVKSWQRAEGQNWADGEWLERLKVFSEAHGLSMNKREAQWYMFIHEGIIGDDVAAYLGSVGLECQRS